MNNSECSPVHLMLASLFTFTVYPWSVHCFKRALMQKQRLIFNYLHFRDTYLQWQIQDSQGSGAYPKDRGGWAPTYYLGWFPQNCMKIKKIEPGQLISGVTDNSINV